MKKFNGVVEGFFSEPLPIWTTEERINIIEYLGSLSNINTYLYCPKNDEYVTDKWNELYSQDSLNDLKAVVEECKKNNIDFYYGFNPGFNLEEIEKDYNAYINTVLNKIKQLQSIGVNGFCILYDDIQYAYNILANEKSEQDYKIGALQCRVVNEIKTFLGKDNWLAFCPSDYFFVTETEYVRAVRENLNDDIYVIWTGDQVFTPFITETMINQAQKTIGENKKILWWDNYPVNDCEFVVGTFNIGGFNAPQKNVYDQLGGILINPMREAYANKVAFKTFSIYLNDPVNYNREKVLNNILDNSLKNIYESFSYRNTVDTEYRGYLLDLFDAETVKDIKIIVNSIKKDYFEVVRDNNDPFLQTTSNIIKRAELFIQLIENLLDSENYQEFFIELDVFPITKKKRYLTQLYKVIMNRVAFLESIDGKFDQQFLDEVNTLNGIYNKYQNKNRLNITKQDEEILLNSIEKIIVFQQKAFLNINKKLGKLESMKNIIKYLF